MKTKIKISEFIRTGKFGPVSIGDSFETVIEKLGIPDGHGPFNERNNREKHIHYGSYEFFILDGKLNAIQNVNFNPEYPHRMEYQNEVIKIEVGFFEANRTKLLREVKTELKVLSIPFTIIDFFGRKALKSDSRVVIDFNNEKIVEIENEMDYVEIDTIEDHELLGISYWPNTN